MGKTQSITVDPPVAVYSWGGVAFYDLLPFQAIEAFQGIGAGLAIPQAAANDLLTCLRIGRYQAVRCVDELDNDLVGYFVWERRLGAFQTVLVNFPPRRGAGWTIPTVNGYFEPRAAATGCYVIACDVERTGMQRRLSSLGFKPQVRMLKEI